MLHPIIVKYLSVSYYKAYDLILNGRVSSFLCIEHRIIWLITTCWAFFSVCHKKAKVFRLLFQKQLYGVAIGTMCGTATDPVQRPLL